MLAFSSSLLLQRSWGQNRKFVMAETAFGKVRGIQLRGINIFKGVPYGASTSGANRFMPPVNPDNWTGVRDTLEYGHSAPQSVSSVRTKAKTSLSAPGPSIFSALAVPGNKPTGEGEDCLVLNVWTPGLKDGEKRPVMLWLHGGGFGSGSGSNAGWDGTNLCLRGNVVVITINHRLNVLGFANFSECSADFAASGDAGIMDIVHALKWVKSNIQQFGGDPDRVMIFGQSGGGRKVETLLAMPSAKGLFHRATIESGVAMKVCDLDAATRNADQLLNKLGVSKSNVHKVQKLPLEEIMAAYFAVTHEWDKSSDAHNWYNYESVSGFVPTAGNQILPQHPFYPKASSVSADVPVMIGSNRTEWTGLTTDAILWHLDEKDMTSQVNKMLGEQSNGMIKLYRELNPHATPSDIFFLIASDYHYVAPTMEIAERRSALKAGPVYQYYFTWKTPVQNGQLMSPHNLEWPFAFHNTEICAALTGGGLEANALADKVSDAWIAFAHTGNPNAGVSGFPEWRPFMVDERATMVINNISTVENDPLRERRLAMFHACGFD